MRVQKPRARTDDLVIEEVEDEVLVYDSTNKRAHCLGATAARVWRACDGDSDVSALSETLELSPEVITQALDELEALELLDTQVPKVVQAGSGNGNAGSGNGSGITRRQLTGRTARVGAGVVVGSSLIYSINVTSAAATAVPFQCNLFTTHSCGSSVGCCAIAGCCCCCQGGGSCKTCGATAFCSTTAQQTCAPLQNQPKPGTNCSCEGMGTIPPDTQGCCGVRGAGGGGGQGAANNCGCGFGPPGTTEPVTCSGPAGITVNIGTQSGCCSTAVGSEGEPCCPGDDNCVPCCNGMPLQPAGSEFEPELGCCTSPTENCCVESPPACCARSCPKRDPDAKADKAGFGVDCCDPAIAADHDCCTDPNTTCNQATDSVC